jgi:ubiquinone/menaquinone biosynthesis C-methylase UbiE
MTATTETTGELLLANPWGRLTAVSVMAVFLAGFFFPGLGVWTSAICTAWLIGTQKPWRGFVFILATSFLPAALWHWNKTSMTTAAYLGWAPAAMLIGALPYLMHRLTSRRLQGLLSTLPLPLWGVVFQEFGRRLLPLDISNLISPAQSQHSNTPLLQIAGVLGSGAIAFAIYWLAALVNWMWDLDFRPERIGRGAAISATIFIVAIIIGVYRQFTGHAIPADSSAGDVWPGLSLLAAVILTGWAFTRPDKQRTPWAGRPDALALLRSPLTGDPLHITFDHGREILQSRSGEQFPIRDGIPDFATAQDLAGPNLKYNKLYQAIAGFYDSTQKVGLALMNVNRRNLILSSVAGLQIKPGDRVLETSVGTGLMFGHLPGGVKLSGLDLSWGMLANCQENLRRWDLEADLFRGNAESLPFADNSFDVVYHCGGINFFGDIRKAIAEMIRVAKPGTRILICDETEEYVKKNYERMPIGGKIFKGRAEAVAAPIALVPPEMLELNVDVIFRGQGYVLTFRKPIG